jgi:fructokinase
MSKFYVIGETLIDIVQTPDGQSNNFLGGSPANIAVTLGRLGADIELITAFNVADELGQFALSEMKRSKVVPFSGSSSAVPQTLTALATVGESGSATYTFEYDETLPIPAVSELAGAKALHAGSLSTHQPNYGAKILEFFKQAHETGVKTFYDPNIRPTIIPEVDFVRDLTEQYVANSDVVKVSDEDLEWLYHGDDVLESAKKWKALGPKIVVMTQGGEGATALFADSTALADGAAEQLAQIHVDTPKVEVADTVGAGDSFMGSLILQLTDANLDALSESDITETLEFCAKVAGITVSRAGANPPFSDELD